MAIKVPPAWAGQSGRVHLSLEKTMRAVRKMLVPGIALVAGVACWAQAQQVSAPGAPLYTSKPILSAPVTGVDQKDMVLMSVSIQPTGAVPMHTHPGDCIGSVVEGTVELLVEGQGPKRFTAGEAYSNPRGTVHGFRNVGDTQARLLNSLFVDRGVPRVQPAAQPAKP